MRGQSSIEFLSTYGWAIMIALLALGALTYFGFVNVTTQTPDRCELWPEFHCPEAQVTSDGKILLSIRNNLPELSRVNVTLETNDCTLLTSEYVQVGVPTNLLLKGQSNNNLVEFTCDGSLQERSRFIADISVSYVERDRTIVHRVQGILRQTVQ